MIITIAKALEFTDRMGGLFEDAGTPLAALETRMQNLIDFFFGGASNSYVSIGDPTAQVLVGQQAQRSLRSIQGSGFYNLLFTNLLGGMSSYLMTAGGAASGLPVSVVDLASYLRNANGCSDPSPAGGGTGSTYTYLAHPSYAALINLLLGGASPLPPDVVFAPNGVVLGSFNAATGVFTPGNALLTPSTAPYAPASLFTGATPPAGPALPNGSLFVTVTGTNQAGASVTWRGDLGTGLTGAGQILAAGILKHSGQTNGGTAAAGDRLLHVTGIARDTTVSSGGTATQGVVEIVTLAERPSL